jgi:hypothetical protein
MPVKFPKRRADGSFCVQISLQTDAPDPAQLANRINSWFCEWAQANRYWHTKFSNVSPDFFDQFIEAPSCIVSGDGFLYLRIEGKADAKKWWKDWMILRIMPAVREAFKEITGFEKISNCPDV